MKISVFGLGYVGCVSAACIAKQGNQVIGVDINSQKVEIINDGRSPIIEEEIDDIFKQVVNNGKLSATMDCLYAVNNSDLSMICVGTPSAESGDIELGIIKKVCQEIGEALKNKTDGHIIVIRSTVLPGTTQKILVPIIEEYSGKKVGKDIIVVYNPEFLREGSSVYDFYNPPFTLIGANSSLAQEVCDLYSYLEAPLIQTSIETSETVKYSCNAFHALKIAFANEIGTFCKAHNVDGFEVMDILCRDDKLNISKAYMKPGFAFGGSCLPKDLRALNYRANRLNLHAPLLKATLDSNYQHLQRAKDIIIKFKNKKIGNSLAS